MHLSSSKLGLGSSSKHANTGCQSPHVQYTRCGGWQGKSWGKPTRLSSAQGGHTCLPCAQLRLCGALVEQLVALW